MAGGKVWGSVGQAMSTLVHLGVHSPQGCCALMVPVHMNAVCRDVVC